MKLGRLIIAGAGMLAIVACMGPAVGAERSFSHFSNFDETFESIGGQDGWVVEQWQAGGLGSGVGRETDSSGTGLRVGDENAYEPMQIRSILSFDTSALPDNAIITSVELRLRQESSVIGGGNPFEYFRGLVIDIKMGSFGSPSLEAADFQALADISSFGPFQPRLAQTYTFPLGRAAYPYINKWHVYGGLTQLRMRFVLDSNRNGRPDYIHFSSGDEPVEDWRPKLVVRYHLPSPIEVGRAP